MNRYQGNNPGPSMSNATRINQIKFGNRKFSMSPPKPIDSDFEASLNI